MTNAQRFDTALYGVPPRLRSVLCKLTDAEKAEIEEIRLRNGLPVALTVRGGCAFLLAEGRLTRSVGGRLITVQAEDIADSFRLLCRSSVYAHGEELKNGFIMMQYGHRAGVCGRRGTDGSLHDISSLNIRIAREIKGCADPIAASYTGGGLLLAGPPGSGKTTLLRDLVRHLSEGTGGRPRRVAVIDSRGEISGSAMGKTYHDLGVNTDVLMISDKAVGIEIAVRTLFPDVVAFDEIGTAEELKSVSESFCAGVEVVTTAHIGEAGELMRRPVTHQLLTSGAVGTVAVLSPCHGPIRLYQAKEIFCECSA